MPNGKAHPTPNLTLLFWKSIMRTANGSQCLLHLCVHPERTFGSVQSTDSLAKVRNSTKTSGCTCPSLSACDSEHAGRLLDATKTSFAIPCSQCVIVWSHSSLQVLCERMRTPAGKTPLPNRREETLFTSAQVLFVPFCR